MSNNLRSFIIVLVSILTYSVGFIFPKTIKSNNVLEYKSYSTEKDSFEQEYSLNNFRSMLKKNKLKLVKCLDMVDFDVQKKNESCLIHFEVYSERIPNIAISTYYKIKQYLKLLFNYLPFTIRDKVKNKNFIRQFVSKIDFLKPIAKAGMRQSSFSSLEMTRFLSQLFHSNSSINTHIINDTQNFTIDKVSRTTSKDWVKNFQIGLLIYMWVSPSYRKLKEYSFSQFLLYHIINECQAKKDDFLLLVHDDNGSNKLIEYYKKHHFILIDEFLPKGMVKQI